MEYVRVYTDENDETHFENVEVGFSLVDFAPPAPPLNATKLIAATKLGFISASPGWYGDWHPAPQRQFIFYLTGEIEAEVSDGEVRRFGPGSVTFVEDTTGKGHKSRVIGSDDVLAVVVQLDN